MKLTELRDELATRAGESERHAYGDLLPGVRRKVRTTKRNRIAGATAGAAAVAIVAAGIVPGLTGSSTPDPARSPSAPSTGSDGMPLRMPSRAQVGDVNKNGITFRARIAGETLLAGVIGDRGQAETRTTVAPRSTEIGLRFVCVSTARKNTRFEIVIDGEVRVDGDDCAQPRITDPLDSSGSVYRLRLTDADVGTPMPVVARLVDRTTQKPITDASVLLAVAAYEPGPQRTLGSVRIPEQYEHQGYLYRLTGLQRQRLTATTKLGISTPADTPFLVAYGGYGGGAVAIDLACGSGRDSDDWTGLGSGATAWAMCPARTAGRAELTWSGQGATPPGEFFVAVYTQS